MSDVISQKTTQKLDGKNWADWSKEMKQILSEKGLFHLCEYETVERYFQERLEIRDAIGRKEKIKWLENSEKAKALIENEVETKYSSLFTTTTKSVYTIWRVEK
jgi:hypothetical protein